MENPTNLSSPDKHATVYYLCKLLYIHPLLHLLSHQTLFLAFSLSLGFFFFCLESLSYPLSLSMKRAKVSSVYEGRGGKRSKEGEGESDNSSKSARKTAKARTDGVRARKALSIISNKRTIVTRSMTMKTMGQKDEEKLFDVEVIQAKEEEKNQQQQPVNEVVVGNKGDDGGLLTLDDWPSTWSLEEDWPWFKVRYECGWYSQWETMNGDFWTPMGDNNKDPFWNNGLWDFKDNNEIPKP